MPQCYQYSILIIYIYKYQLILLSHQYTHTHTLTKQPTQTHQYISHIFPIYILLNNNYIRLLNNIIKQPSIHSHTSMINQNTKNQLIQYLSLTLVPDSKTVKDTTLQLNQLSKQAGFCMMMMQIADDQSQSIPIRQASLIQLKNLLKRKWNSSQHQISVQQKTAILNALIPAFLQSSSSYLLLKLYKQVVTIIIGYVYKQWIPIDILCSKINTDQQIVPILHFIIAIQTNFQISISDDERQAYYKFLAHVLPAVYACVQRNGNEEVVYLVMKIIWKVVHYEISEEIRLLVCNFMDLVLSVIGASNQQMEAQFEETQVRGSMEFYYFHAKKWATRILYRFIYSHASPVPRALLAQDKKQAQKQFSKKWYETYGQRVVEVITNQFMVPTIKKTRYFQIKCLTGLINTHPQQMKQYSQSFQYQILIPYLQLKPEDEEVANNDPIQFMNKQDDYSMDYGYLKKVATQAWVAFTNIGMKKKKKSKEEQMGALFQQNMAYLKSKLEGTNPLQKQMAMYLICQLRQEIVGSEQMKSFLPVMITKLVVPEFTSQIMFLRARSMQIFDEYGDLFLDEQSIKKAVQGIYFCLTQDNYPLVRLKAASAFHVLLQHKKARDQVKPLFAEILRIYLMLLEKYDSQTLVHSLSGIVEHFALQVGPYACQLMKYLSKHFIKLFHKDKSQAANMDYDGETQFAAAGVLGTMKTLLQSPIDKESISKMQSDILDTCDQIFTSNDADYIDDALSVLRAYTHRASAISQRLLFYYVLLVYYVVGIDQHLWQKIPTLPIPDIYKKGLDNVKKGANIQSISQVTLVLRNYIALDTSILVKMNDPFGINLLELLFNMINQIYQKGPNQFDGQVQMNDCTILLVYLLQNNHKKWDDTRLTQIYQVIKYNLLKAKSKLLQSINAQLICVYIWNNSQKFVTLALSDNLLQSAINCILRSQPKMIQQHQRQRILLGLSQLFIMANKPQQIIMNMPKLFNLMITFVKKNCDFRLNQDGDEHYKTDSQQQDSAQQQLDFNVDEPEDIWQQDFQNNYSSKLDQVDQIKYFKQCMQQLQEKQSNLYTQLIATVPADQLISLDGNMTKAIDLNVVE